MPVDASRIFQYAADMQKAPGRVGKEAADTVRKSGTQLQRAAQAAAPTRTGALRGSIRVENNGSGNSGSISARVFTDLRYAFFVEHGTSKMPPQPFLSPSVDGVEGPFYAAIEAAIQKGFGN